MYQRRRNPAVEWKSSLIIESVDSCARERLGRWERMKLSFEKFPDDALCQMILIKRIVCTIFTHGSSGPTGKGSVFESRRLARNKQRFRASTLCPPKHDGALVEFGGGLGALPHGGGNNTGSDTFLANDMDVLGGESVPPSQIREDVVHGDFDALKN